MRKVFLLIFSFLLTVLFFFVLKPTNLYAQTCPRGYQCYDMDPVLCNTLGGISQACLLSGGVGNCCIPYIPGCPVGTECRVLTPSECSGAGGTVRSCTTVDDEFGNCCLATPGPTCDPGENCCTCTPGIPIAPGLCPWKLGVDNCNSGFLPICPELAACTPTPPCICEPVGSLDCGQENEECCPGDVCDPALQCTQLGFGYSRCLRPCSDDTDCNSGEICNDFGGCVNDPFSEDTHGIKIPIFCDASGQPTTDNTGELYTAIGCIPFSTGNLFIRFILRWGIGIAGGIAFILIIVAGFQITTSQGDPKKLQAGRELLTSAIAGLVLLIFSVLILRLIGVNLLGIPGFGS